MKKFTTLKTLLVGLLACAATSAWADMTALNPTATTRLHAGEADNTHYDAEATSWTCTISSQTGKKFKNDNSSYGGSYVVITQFDASSVLSGKSLTGAKLKFHSVCTSSGKNSLVRVWSIGTGWTASTATWNNTNTDEIIDGSIIHTTAGINTTGSDIEVDVTSLLRDDADKIIGFGFSTVSGREQAISGLSLEVTYSSEVLYLATFTENNSLNPTVTIYSDEERTSSVLNGALADKTTYYYRAVLEGYNDYDGSFTVNGANPSESFTMTAKERYTFTVNAVNSDGGAVITAFYTDEDSYDGKTHNVSFPAYLTGENNVVTYSKDDAKYYQSYTSASAEATKTVPYTAYTGEAWFFEGEDVTGAKAYTGASFGSRSSSGAAGVLSAATVTSLEAGLYKITARAIGKVNNTHSIYKTSTEGEKILDIVSNTTGTIESAIFSLDATTDIVANGGYYTTSDNGFGFDYILIEKNPTLSVTISDAGYATYINSKYPLDFSNVSGLTAYTASIDGKNVLFHKATKIPANTGVLLKGAANTYQVPVIADGGNATSELVGGTTAPVGSFVLMNEGGKVGFYKTKYEFTVGANTAYIPAQVAEVVTSRDFIAIDGEATAIKAIETNKQGGEIFNLAGQRVNKAQKGLYIQNGKKVIIK